MRACVRVVVVVFFFFVFLFWFFLSTYTATNMRKDQTGFLLFKTSVCVLQRVKLGLGVTLRDRDREILRQNSMET